ncbi:hypothetical protein CRG98_039683 [Punica granatum]|uniref:Uncharacterized protein n=1 Tax=Punica granatum TaxID=22663 RepID=A0A2I0I8E5_PUNGR|nr:hypothetical protein CRG98_039683 [Punica granatum]
MAVPGVRDVLASVSILVCKDSVGSSCADGLCRDANQETECGIPYQDEKKIDLRLINANGILILKIYMIHVCENVNTDGLIHVTRYMYIALETEKDSNWHAGRLDGLLSGWRMTWRHSTMHGFGTTETVLREDGGLPTQGCQFLKIKWGSLEA